MKALFLLTFISFGIAARSANHIFSSEKCSNMKSSQSLNIKSPNTLKSSFGLVNTDESTCVNFVSNVWKGVNSQAASIHRAFAINYGINSVIRNNTCFYRSTKDIIDTTDIRFEYNADSINKTISLDANYMDVKGAVYSGSITLAPYSSVVLVKKDMANQSPTVTVGLDTIILLPSNAINLSGVGIDQDGTISSYLWTKISGPLAYNIENPDVASTLVTGLVQGEYQFELVITDNKGAVSKDTMKVNVVQGALPLNLWAFKGFLAGSKVSLSWSTNKERNFSRFEIEKIISTKWKKIGNIEASGKDLENMDYYFSDYLPEPGLNSYRLRVLDVDGHSFYSDVIGVELKTRGGSTQNFPNPFSDLTTIQYDVTYRAFVKIVIFNNTGTQIAVLASEIKQPGLYQIQWNARNYLSGIYFYSLRINNNITVRKMVKTSK